MPYLNQDQLADAFAVCFHSENLTIVASRDVELDVGAAAVWVISICGSDGHHCVSNRCVLRQSVLTILQHIDTET